MKKALFGMMAFVAMAIVGCSNEPVEQDVLNAGVQHVEAFYGTIESQECEDEGTRTSLGENNAILWNQGDAITLFTNYGYVHKMVTAGGGNTDVQFDEADDCPCIETTNQYSAHYAVYPWSESNEIDGDTETFTVDMSGLATQSFTAGSYDSGKAVMVSKTTTSNIYFKNTLSMIRCKFNAQVGGEYVINSVKLSSASKALAGTATIALSDYTAKINNDGVHTIALVSESGIVLKKAVTEFYILLPAGTYNDMVITVEGYKRGIENTPVVQTTNISTTFKRNAIKNLTRTFTSESWNGSTSDEKVWDGETYTEPAVADGVMNINTPAEFAWLGTKLAGNKLASANGVNTININGSFDMNGMEFTCVSAFYITLAINGNNNTISNVSFVAPVNGNDVGHNGGAGGAAFVNVSTDANVTIKDLTFSGATATDNTVGNSKAAIVADYVEGVLNLENVHVTNSTVKGVCNLGALVNDVQGGTANITNCSVSKTTLSNIEVADESGCVGSIIGRVAGSANISKTSASDNVIEAYVGTATDQKRSIGDYVGNFTGANGRSLVITEGTITNVNIIAKNALAETQQNIYGEFLGGWRSEGKGSVSINGTEILHFIDTQAEFEAAVKAGGIVYLSANTDEGSNGAYNWVKPTKDVTIIGREGLATRSGAPVYPATINMNKQYNQSLAANGLNIEFDKLNLNFNTVTYGGFHHGQSEKYTNCSITGTVWIYSPVATFENCYFTEMTNNYNIWVYSSCDVTIKNSIFKSDNKSILIYNESAQNYNATIEGCSFEAARATDKCAVQIHNDFGKITGTLVMTNNTATGYENTNDGLWKEWVNGKNITNLVDKTIDGVNLNAKAIADIVAGGDVTLTQDLPVNETFTIPAGVTTNLDLNGWTIYMNAEGATAAVDFNNKGTLNISNGKIVAKADAAEFARRCIYNRAGGVMNINGVEFVQNLNRGGAVNNAGTMTITDATVTSNYWSIWNEGEGSLTVNSGTFNNNSYTEVNDQKYCYAVKNTGNAQMTINGGTFNCTHGFLNADGGEVIINGGDVKHTSTLNQSAHAFYTQGENTKVTIPVNSTVKVKWSANNGSTVVWNESAKATNIAILGGLYATNNSHNKYLYFTASGNEEYPYTAIDALAAINAAAGAGLDYTMLESIEGAVTQKRGTINGNGFTLKLTTSGSVLKTYGGKVENITIKGNGTDGFAVNILDPMVEDLYIDNATLTAKNSFYVSSNSSYKAYISNSTLKGALMLNGKKIAELHFSNCDINAGGKYGFYLGQPLVTFTECNFTKGDMVNIPSGAVVLKDCYLDGVLITADNLSKFVASGASRVTINNTLNVAKTNDELKAAIAAAQNNDVIWVDGEFTGCFEIVGKTVIIKNAGSAKINGMIFVDSTKSKFVGLTLSNTEGVTSTNYTAGGYSKINSNKPVVGAWNYADVTFENCTFNFTKNVNTYGFYGHAWNSPVFENCTFNCANIRPIANNGAAITVNGCTFKNPHQYAVRLFENSSQEQTVVFTNNTITGKPSSGKEDFEGINFSNHGTPAVANVVCTISGNTCPEKYGELKYRYHENYGLTGFNVTAKDCTLPKFEREGSVAAASGADEFAAAMNNPLIETINLAAGEYKMPAASKFTANTTIICAEGTVFTGASGLNIKGATIVGATFKNNSGNAVSGTINGTFKGCTFEGKNALRGCYAGETVVFEDCVFSGGSSCYAVHFDAGANDVIFRNCTLSGFSATGAALTMVTFEGCTFVGNGKNGYNGINLWGSATLKDCEFTFDGSSTNEWVDCINNGGNKTYEFTNCTINGVPYTAENYTEYTKIDLSANATVKINGVDCAL